VIEVAIVVAAVAFVALLAWGTIVRAVHQKAAMGLGVDDAEPVKTFHGIVAVVLSAVVAILGVSLDGVLRWVVIALGAWAVFSLLGAIGRPWHEAMRDYEAELDA
jgi:hypothetical protein